MSNIDTIRVIIQDTPLYAKQTVLLDGSQKSTQLTYFPVIVTSVIITPPSSVPAFTVDEDNGVLAFATAPTAGSYVIEYKHVNLLDASIQTFIDLETNVPDLEGETVDLKLPAADCLDAIASSQALIQKCIKILDLQTNGAALAKALRDHADSLRQQVYSPEFVESSFDTAEQINDQIGFREKVIKDWLRQE